jgi:hypothetical protein
LNRHNPRHLRHSVAEIALDAVVEGQIAAGAPVAGAMKADLDDPIVGNADQLNIAAVRLDGWANQVDYALDALSDVGLRFSGVHR